MSFKDAIVVEEERMNNKYSDFIINLTLPIMKRLSKQRRPLVVY